MSAVLPPIPTTPSPAALSQLLLIRTDTDVIDRAASQSYAVESAQLYYSQRQGQGEKTAAPRQTGIIVEQKDSRHYRTL